MASSSLPKDCLSTVEEYLDRGQVYRPLEEFVKQLALCPRCIGGKEQCKVLEESLLRMTALVKSKLNEPGRRNVSSSQAWLKNAAKAMELYQVISREWICAYVWKLPDLPKRIEQDYDTTKGRKDIRFYPEGETKLFELTEEESMEVGSLQMDEEELLSISPVRGQKEETSSESPRRSPRLLKKTLIQLSPEKKSVSRVELKEPRQTDACSQTCSQGKRSQRQEPQKTQQMDARSQTCSQGKRSQRQEPQKTQQMDARSQTCSQGKRSQRQEPQKSRQTDARSRTCSQGKRSPQREVTLLSTRPVRAETSSQARKDSSSQRGVTQPVTLLSTRPVRAETSSQARKDSSSQREVTLPSTRPVRTETCSQVRKELSPQKEVTLLSNRPVRTETCSQVRKDLKESTKKPQEDTQAGPSKATVPKSVHFAKKLQVVCCKEGKRTSKQKELSVMSQRGACSSDRSDRHVQIVEGSPINILKRSATSHKEELIISTSELKKIRTEDIVSQVRQKAEERREMEVKKRERRSVQKCWVPGCTSNAKHLKAHPYFVHIPSIFDERLNPTDEQVLNGRRNALKQAGRWLLGRPVELDELVAFIVVQKMLSNTDNTEVTQRQETAMREFCKFLHEPVPDKFVIEPCNSTGVLLHWKALLLIAASLGEEERQYWLKTFTAPREMSESQPAVPVKFYPDAMDSHIHLDRTLRDMQLPPHGSLDEIINSAPVDEDKKINLVSAVAIYCDPRTYPSERYLQEIPQHISVGLGFHPKHAKNSLARIEDEVHQFRRLIRNPRIVAFGEIGLDHSEPMKHWASQVELLEKVLPFLEDQHVLVIHCRGMHGDCGTEAYLLLLHCMRKYVRSHQPMHLHCFTGNKYVVERWLEVFPRTFFGLTNLVDRFDERQIAALRSLEESRLLLESDSPYFPIQESRVSSPSQLWAAAAAVATHRRMTPERVLEITLANGQHLYGGQQ